jgi:hypothetical protein
MQKKLISSITVLLFFIWILPLGSYIKPSQEKIACNGQRAICMCSHMTAKMAHAVEGKTIQSGSGETQKQESNPSSNPYIYFTHDSRQANARYVMYPLYQANPYSYLVVLLIDHVPISNPG